MFHDCQSNNYLCFPPLEYEVKSYFEQQYDGHRRATWPMISRPSQLNRVQQEYHKQQWPVELDRRCASLSALQISVLLESNALCLIATVALLLLRLERFSLLSLSRRVLTCHEGQSLKTILRK
jgi:hypothetical protein